MSHVLVRYKFKPDMGDFNEQKVKRVFAELKEKAPAGVRYGTLRLEDGVTFVHVASIQTADGSNPSAELAAFKEFQAGLKERCDEPPSPGKATIVGSHGIFDRAPPATAGIRGIAGGCRRRGREKPRG